MKPALPTLACAICALALAACNSEQPRQPAANDAAADAEANPNANVDLSKVELPPPVIRSLAFRCTDGNELFVEVLEGENSVLVRDKAGEPPAKLTREGGSGAFTGDDRTLSGIGDVATYSSPDRPNQRCGQ